MTTSRRAFLQTLSLATVTLTACAKAPADRPNILWITCEDMSCNVGCYGDAYAITPTLDQMAADGVLYENMYATAPVCSPARSCIITGIHAVSLGTQHLRSNIEKPKKVRCYPEYLREAGYYCTNNSKEDYQFKTPENAWDESSKTAHWRNKPEGKPFFAIFNLMTTHQSQTRYDGAELAKRNAGLPAEQRHDPAKAPLPPYYPDTKIIRDNVAAYYTQITIMDQTVADLLKQLDEDGLTDSTIVVFYADHGAGLPRGKRWLHRNGLHVPFIIRFPEKYKHLAPSAPGSRRDEFVTFADLAPTTLSLLGLPIPNHIQGRAFLGAAAKKPPKHVFAARSRVDEVIVCSRTIIDDKYQYIRNFLPHRPRMPISWFSELTPIRQEIRRLYAEGKLKGAEAWLMAPSIPAEELFELSSDPHEMNNLAMSAQHQKILTGMRETLYGQMLDMRDSGVLSEHEMHARTTVTPYDTMQSMSAAEYGEIMDTAKLVGMGAQHRNELIEKLANKNSAVRYWAATGLAALGADAAPAAQALQKVLTDQSLSVRVSAAEALCNIDLEAKALPVLADILQTGDEPAATEAAASLFYIGPKAAPVKEQIRKALERKLKDAGPGMEHVLEQLGN
jgi:arylsulfatase A-like enzyme